MTPFTGPVPMRAGGCGHAAFHCWRTSRGVRPWRAECGLYVLYSILCCSANTFASGNDANSSIFKNSSLSRLLNDSTNGFSQGEPGGMYSAPDPLPVHQPCNAWAMNSGPLSIRRWVGAGYCLRSSSIESITSIALHRLPTRIARHMRLYSSTILSNFSLRPSIVWSNWKSIAHTWCGYSALSSPLEPSAGRERFCLRGRGLWRPSSRQIRCTRLWLTLQPSIRRRR